MQAALGRRGDHGHRHAGQADRREHPGDPAQAVGEHLLGRGRGGLLEAGERLGHQAANWLVALRTVCGSRVAITSSDSQAPMSGERGNRPSRRAFLAPLRCRLLGLVLAGHAQLRSTWPKDVSTSPDQAVA